MSVRRRDFLRTAALAGAAGGRIIAAEEPRKPSSPFLEGNYAPVREEITAERLEVVGAIPKELDGVFVRNGPNPQFAPMGKYHWFDGDGMLHGVRLRDGRASYRNRYVRTKGWTIEHEAGRAIWGGLNDPPDLTKLARGLEMFKNAANTALVWHDGRLLALWEGGEPYEVKVPGLETVGPYTFDGKLTHPFTAHPKIDHATGELLFFGYQPIAPFLQYSVADADGVIVRTTPIELPRPVMMHDFAATEKHTLFLDLPATFSFGRLAKREPLLKFEPDLGARVGVLPRRGEGKDVKWFDIPACYVFHTLNAFDDGDSVVLLACRYPRLPDLATTGGPSKREDLPRLHRWRLDLAAGTAREEAVDDTPCEFPRVDDARLGRRTRFGYALEAASTALLKFDLDRGTTARHEFGPGRLGGEAVFVPRQDGRAEDDGWLVTFVFDGAKGSSELLLVDAADFTSPPVARVLLPQRVPFGFHGAWIDGQAISAAART